CCRCRPDSNCPRRPCRLLRRPIRTFCDCSADLSLESVESRGGALPRRLSFQRSYQNSVVKIISYFKFSSALQRQRGVPTEPVVTRLITLAIPFARPRDRDQLPLGIINI